MSVPKNKLRIWPLILYPPISCLIIGLLSNVMRLSVPATGSRAFVDVFWAHALRFPEDFNILRWMTLGIGWIFLLLMVLSLRSRKPIITLAEIRIVLLVLIVVITLLAQVFTVASPLASQSAGGIISSENYKGLTILLFLFIDIDLILVFASTFLSIFKPLKRRLV
jgi:hypothetical protein